MMKNWVHHLGIASLLLLTLASCAAQTPVLHKPGARALTENLAEFPKPNELLSQRPRQSASVDTALVKSGDAFDPSLPNNLVTGQGDSSALYDSKFSGSQALDKLSYATYRFDLTGYSGPLDFYHGWGKAPKPTSSAWLGVSNFNADTWDWTELELGTLASVPGLAAHQAGDGTLFAAVVLVGIDQPRLDLLMLGNEPPVAVINTTDAVSGPPGLNIQFDGSASADPDGSLTDISWDPEGDGTFLPHLGIGPSTLTHTFCTPGTFHTTLRVTDNQGAQDTASITVTVSLGEVIQVTLDTIASGTSGALCLKEVNGKPAVAYMTNDALYYTRATGSSGQTWVSPVTITTDCSNNGVDLAVVGGRPALAYQNWGYDLACVWADDADGATWAESVVAFPNTGENPGMFPSIEDGNNLPIIVHGDTSAFTSGDIWLSRATASDLSSWAPPKKLSASTPGVVPSIAWVNGLPSVIYATAQDLFTPGRFRYVRSNTNWDVSWQPPLAPLPSGQQGLNSSSLAAVGLLPAVVYYDKETSKLEYLRAQDADGLQWDEAVTALGTSSISDFGFAFAVINNVPCIAYAIEPGGMFGGVDIVLARDTRGSSWGEPIEIDQSSASAFITLAEVNQRPAIAWIDAATSELRYVGYKP